jgi:hypothetical protein
LLAFGCVVFGEVCDVPPEFNEPGTVARSCFDAPVVFPTVVSVPFLSYRPLALRHLILLSAGHPVLD